MGLDMYLTVEKYVGGWKYSSAKERRKFDKIKELVGLDGINCDGSPSLTVEVTVAYWRKANHIHNWFVQNCQGGKDECQRTYVDRTNLEQLVKLCKEVLADRSRAAELLPTKSGFFFGSVTIAEWYFQDLEDTIKQLESVLKYEAIKNSDFYYRSSW